MSRIRFISALAVSIAFIGGALWFRFVRVPPYTASSIVAVSQVDTNTSSSEDARALTDFFNTATSTTATSTAITLSQTDLVGRQLFSDYMALKSQGPITANNINSLAENYAESIKNVEISIPKINSNQVMVVLDSEANLTAYGNALTNIRNKYKNLVTTQTQNSKGDITDTNSLAFSTFMGTLGKLYKASANELLLIRVPASLVINHTNLINHYLETADVMRLISNSAKDPVQAYAALNIYTKNSERESELLINIQKIMQAHGIIFNSSI